MYSFKRSARVREELLKEINNILRDDIKDFRLGFFTITTVELTDNLASARVYVSPMGSEQEKTDTFEAISEAAGRIRHLLGKRMRLRHIPQLHFNMDDSPEKADQLNRIFHEIEKERDEHEHKDEENE